MRELTWMVEGRGEFEWSMTANLLALQINMNRGKGSKAVHPSELNPFSRKQKKKIVLSGKDSMNLLRNTFCPDPK